MRIEKLVQAVPLAILWAAAATAKQPQVLGEKEFVAAVDGCLAANEQSEFEGPEQVLTKVKASCQMTATVRFPARGHPILGNVLRYDPASSSFVWNSMLGVSNRFYGGGASPYRLTATPSGFTSPGASPEIIAMLTEVGNAHFWLLPIFRTAQERDSYEGSNVYGTEREVTRVKETRYGIAAHIPKDLSTLSVLQAPIAPGKAKEVADHLDIAVTFQVGEVCRVCYKANTVRRGTKPTIRSPIDEEITTRFVYGNILRMDLIDRRTGETLYTSTPAT